MSPAESSGWFFSSRDWKLVTAPRTHREDNTVVMFHYAINIREMQRFVFNQCSVHHVGAGYFEGNPRDPGVTSMTAESRAMCPGDWLAAATPK